MKKFPFGECTALVKEGPLKGVIIEPFLGENGDTCWSAGRYIDLERIFSLGLLSELQPNSSTFNFEFYDYTITRANLCKSLFGLPKDYEWEAISSYGVFKEGTFYVDGDGGKIYISISQHLTVGVKIVDIDLHRVREFFIETYPFD